METGRQIQQEHPQYELRMLELEAAWRARSIANRHANPTPLKKRAEKKGLKRC